MNEKEEKRTMLDVLEELSLSLESMRKMAVDQKTFYSGYLKCVLDLGDIIRVKTCQLEDETYEDLEPEQENITNESPLIVDA